MEHTFKKAESPLSMPAQLGIFLAANAVSDAVLAVDGLHCAIHKADYIAGNHDLRSTLLSDDGRHRVLYSMAAPLPQERDPEGRLAGFLRAAAGSPGAGVVLLTALPFLKLTGADYSGLAAAAGERVPVADAVPSSMEADWLDGYALALDALVRALGPRKTKKNRRDVALVGYMYDRGEGDHAGNIAELGRLLGACGLRLRCVLPSGAAFRDLSAALEAGVVVSLPYGREAAARLASASGARLVETGLPMGFAGTARWLESVCAAAGVKPPSSAARLRREAALSAAPALRALANRKAAFFGDPWLFGAFAGFAEELCMTAPFAVLACRPRGLSLREVPELLLFSPRAGEAREALASFSGCGGPDLAVGNSFWRSEGLAPGLPFMEFGFPSYGRHALSAEPFLGYEGAVRLVSRLLNTLQSGAG